MKSKYEAGFSEEEIWRYFRKEFITHGIAARYLGGTGSNPVEAFFFFLYITVIAWIADQRRGPLLCSRESQKMNGCKRSVSWRPDLNALCPDDLTWVLFFSFFFLFPFALASSVRDQSGVSDWAKGQWVEVAGTLSALGAKSNHYAVYVNKETTRTFDSSFYVLYVTRVYGKRKMTPSSVNFLGKQDKVNTEILSFESETCEILFKDTWRVFVCLFF